jgi:hypothetical protein
MNVRNILAAMQAAHVLIDSVAYCAELGGTNKVKADLGEAIETMMVVVEHADQFLKAVKV